MDIASWLEVLLGRQASASATEDFSYIGKRDGEDTKNAASDRGFEVLFDIARPRTQSLVLRKLTVNAEERLTVWRITYYSSLIEPSKRN